jgi:nucleoside-diphosphate-sugar epimerase
MLHEIEKPEDLNTSALELFGVLLKNTQNDKEVVEGRYTWVDVRDIAEAHVAALEKPEAGGERIIFSAGKLPSHPHVV